MDWASASLLVMAIKKPSFVTAIRCCAEDLLADVGVTSGTVNSPRLLSVFITRITAKGTVLRHAVHARNKCKMNEMLQSHRFGSQARVQRLL